MIWPWVSREVVALLKEELTHERARSAQMSIRLTQADAHYADLLEKYHALRVTGAVTPLPAIVPKDDPVINAIIAKSRGRQALYLHYNEFVSGRRAMGIPDDEIAQEIMLGVEADSGVAL